MSRRGIILAGGVGTRLIPATLATSKQLLPVYDKPMIYYPLSTLIAANVREVLVISTPHHLPAYRHLLGDGERWGLAISFAVQPSPGGIPQAFVIGRAFVRAEPSILVLGDNLFHGEGMEEALRRADAAGTGATIFGCVVTDPARYGVAEVGSDGRVVSVEEKPAAPRSPIAVTGLYYYDGDAVAIAEGLRPSARGETVITDLNREYLRRGRLGLELLGAGTTWFDAGTAESLHDAASFVRSVEARTGAIVGCPEEAAWRRGRIDTEQLLRLAHALGDCPYADYLRTLAAPRTLP